MTVCVSGDTVGVGGGLVTRRTVVGRTPSRRRDAAFSLTLPVRSPARHLFPDNARRDALNILA